MARPTNILISTVKRNQRFRGPTFSDQQNDTQAEVIRDLSAFQQQWNNQIVPLTKLLPDGTQDSEVNAFSNGLDGQTIYVKSDATIALSSGQFYNTVKDRPNTVYEQVVNIYSYIDAQIDTLQESITVNNSGTGITAEQKTRIGDHIFDLSQTSLSTSLDGKVTSQAGYITQIARDMYGTNSPTLNSSGATVLTNSVKSMVDALLELHNGNWDNDITVNHNNFDASVITTGTFSQQRVAASSASGGVNDNYAGSPVNLLDDLNLVRSLLKTFKGTAAFNSAITPDGTWVPVTTQPTSYSNLITLKGSAARSDTNPWGYSYTDIDQLNSFLTAIQTFTGQDTLGDGTPGYSAVNGFNQGDSLETAIGALASGLAAEVSFSLLVSGSLQGQLDSHTGDFNNPHNTDLTQAAAAGGIAPADQISIVDLGSFFTSATVEGALQELAGATIIVPASQISITDSGGYFTSSNVEGALQQLGAYTAGTITTLPQFTNSGLLIDPTIYSTYVDASASGLLIELPSIFVAPNQSFVVKKIDNTFNTITLSGVTGDLIDFSPTFVFSGYLEAVTVQATASGYFII